MIVLDKGKYKLVYKGDLVRGHLSFNRTAMIKELTTLNDGAVEITISNYTDSRSINQNRLMWMWFSIIGKHIGYTPQQVKGIMQVKFLLTEDVIESTGEVVPRVRGTSELDKAEFTEFIDNVYRWSLEFLQLTLPQPNTTIELWQSDL